MRNYWDDIKLAANEALPWEKLQGCNVLVTGATGLIGGCLVEVLMARGDINVYAAGRNEARAKVRFAEYKDNPRFHFFKYDVSRPLSDVSRSSSEEPSIPFHYIIHAASDASPAAFASTPVDVIKSNIYGTANLIEYGIAHGMRRFLYVSTGEVYGEGGATEDTPDGPAFIESDSGYVNPILPRSCYPSSKRAAETLCAAYKDQYGTDVVIARPCHTYGPHFTSSDNRVYAQFVR
ncbi:MAG: NAD-dependent epimerase/dehydratase family protein, partial [Prevotella sp.]|nr:NAD-dependent epimerase/dehydratase family protein [Prevotella sp.]